MWWMALVGAANGLIQGQAGRATAKANNRISQVNADTKNKTRGLSNAAEMAKGRLARYSQSLANNRLLDASGRQQEASTTNQLRVHDAQTVSGVSASLQQAETAGHQAAAAASAGLQGGVVDMIDTSTRLRDAIVDQRTKEVEGQQDYDFQKQRGQIEAQAIQSMDDSTILDNLDFNKDYATITPVVSNFAYALQGSAQSLGVTGVGDMIKNNQQPGQTGETDASRMFAKNTANMSFTGGQNADQGDVAFKFDLNNPQDDAYSKLKLSDDDYKSSNNFNLWGYSGYGSN